METRDKDETLALVGRRLREERERCNLVLAVAAEELAVHKSVLSRIENGERGLDSVLLRRAAALYDISMDTLFEETGDELIVKARNPDAARAEADAMARWARRKLSELRFVRGESTPT